MHEGAAAEALGVQLRAAHGTDQATNLHRPEVRAQVLAGDSEQSGEPHQALWAGDLFEQGLEHQALAIQAADVPHLVVAEPQEALEVSALEDLAAWLQIDVQALGVVVIPHALGHVDLKAAQGIPQAPDHRQVHQDVVTHRTSQVLGELRLDRIGAAIGVEGVGLHRAKAAGVDVGVPGHLQQLGDAVLHTHRVHHVGIAAADVGSQDHHIGVTEAVPAAEGIDQLVALAHLGTAEVVRDGRGQQESTTQPKANGRQHRCALIAAAGHRAGGGCFQGGTLHSHNLFLFLAPILW